MLPNKSVYLYLFIYFSKIIRNNITSCPQLEALPLLFPMLFMMCFIAFDKAADLDVLDHPIQNFIYLYYLVSFGL